LLCRVAAPPYPAYKTHRPAQAKRTRQNLLKSRLRAAFFMAKSGEWHAKVV